MDWEYITELMILERKLGEEPLKINDICEKYFSKLSKSEVSSF
jgi:hypothetical protein